MDNASQSEKEKVLPLKQSDLKDLTQDSLLTPDILMRLEAIDDQMEYEIMKISLSEEARKLKRVTEFKKLLRGCDKRRNERLAASQSKEPQKPESTDFREIVDVDDDDKPIYGEETPYDGFLVPAEWKISNDGIFRKTSKGNVPVCGRPMLPIAIWKNLEDQKEKAVLVHRVNREWRQFETPRSVISTSSLLTKLSDYGFDTNSKNATFLVSFFSDFINCNSFKLPIYFTTSKLGWKLKKAEGGIEHNFTPYYRGIKFDAESNFTELYNSIGEKGSYSKWLSVAKSVREGKTLAPKIALASSFASVLIYPLGILGFFVDIYGATGGGKTITLMLACSIWANPNENKYIGDFAATRTALETRLDMLNHLPLIIDDTSKKNNWVNYEYTVYDLASGKGKTRSNTSLGNEPEKTWKNIILCNGEHAITDQVVASGAKNRVIEVSCEDHLFEDPCEVVEIVKANYGRAGKEFIEVVKNLDWNELRKRYLDLQDRFLKRKISGKQASSGAAIMLADEIATDYIFKDGKYLMFKEVEKLLLKEFEISEGAECYQYLLDIIEANGAHFDGAPGGPYPSCEQWGIYDAYRPPNDDGKYRYVCWYITFYKKKLEEGGFSRKQFADWARANGVLVVDNGSKDTKVMSIERKSQRFVILKIDHDIIQEFYKKMSASETSREQSEPKQEPIKTEELEQMTIEEFKKTNSTPFDVGDPVFD